MVERLGEHGWMTSQSWTLRTCSLAAFMAESQFPVLLLITVVPHILKWEIKFEVLPNLVFVEMFM